jgi:hypothetical protein
MIQDLFAEAFESAATNFKARGEPVHLHLSHPGRVRG